MKNKSCIVTVIKDEQEYLEEWIKYHLDLGIDYIFIIEDYDSDTHKHITDKYKEVELVNAKEFLTEELFKQVLKMKTTKGCNPQHLYLSVGLNYVKKNHKEYEWCFVTDNDEFITLQDNRKLSDVLEMFKDYDAFSMQWECYGASGYVHKPNYGDKGMIGTYTEKMKGIVLDNPKALVKVCYNLHKFKSEHFFSQHHATDACNWCNTNFEYHSYLPTYNLIYIKHYITRSLEEYLWKKETRGCQTRIDTNLEFFFHINPEMADRKEEYLREVRKETLVILPYANNYSDSDKLKGCLDVWRKYSRFKYRFVVIGDCGDEVAKEYPWAEFMYAPFIKDKETDTEKKKQFVLRFFSSYRDFILLTDDFKVSQPFTLEEVRGMIKKD